ncbi:MAG: ABC transporter permease [Rubrivivax sp.]
MKAVLWPLALVLAVVSVQVPLGSALAGAPWRWGWFGFALMLLLLAVLSLKRLAALDAKGWVGRAATPLIFGAWVLVFWQFLTQAFDVPRVLMPAPSLIWAALLNAAPTLWTDFVQTVLHSVLVGLLVGCGLGFVVGVLIDRSPFLQRGLLPIAALASTVPLVGIAPIMVMWFGFDWHSKAAVVVVMTFFPMLVNTLAGLAEAGHMERDLMRSYGAGYWRTLFSLRIPVALPFVFNALKINSTLALIGAIVAEFFGSPVSGLGFRISTEAARLNMGLVWAAIVVAALAGSLLYAALGWIERRTTFWHPSIRMG